MLSSGHKKEILVLMFVSSMLSTNNNSDLKDDETLSHKDNKSYRTNRRIDRKLIELKERIDKYMEDTVDADTAKWIRKQSPERTKKALSVTVDTEKFSLEFLAVWVMYANFCFRDKPAHESLEYFEKFDYISLADDLEETKVGELNGEMFEIAYDILERLK